MIGQSPILPESPCTPGVEPADALLPPPVAAEPREVGGRDGPEPTRFGDWEKNGRCIDF